MVGAPTINEEKGRSRLDPEDGGYRRLPFYVDFPDLPPVLLDETAEDRTLLGTVRAARRGKIDEREFFPGAPDPRFDLVRPLRDLGVSPRGRDRVVGRHGEVRVFLHDRRGHVGEGEGLSPGDVLDHVIFPHVIFRRDLDGLLLEGHEDGLKIVGVHIPEFLHCVVRKARRALLTVLDFLVPVPFLQGDLLVPPPAPLGVPVIRLAVFLRERRFPGARGARREKKDNLAKDEDPEHRFLLRRADRQRPSPPPVSRIRNTSNRSCPGVVP